MPSNDGIEWAVSDEGGIVRFNLSACLDSIGLEFFTHFAVIALDWSLVCNKLAARDAFR